MSIHHLESESVKNQLPNDPYVGFNDYDHAYDFENVYHDKEFVQAVNRSSYGRRPATSSKISGNKIIKTTNAIEIPSSLFRFGTQASNLPPTSNMRGRMPTAGIPQSSIGIRSRMGTHSGMATEITRPMTAVHAAGYSSAIRKSTFEGIKFGGPLGSNEKREDRLIEKVQKQENAVNELLHESIMAFDEKIYKKALEKAKEAGRKERAVVKFRAVHSLGEANLDLTLTVLLNLAQQYIANNMLNEALHVYHAIVKNKTFPNAGRLKVNIGNIYFRKKDFPKAIKYFRMALDQVPKVEQRIRTKILNNIGVTLIKLGKYEDALATFEDCLDSNGDYDSALNLILSAYCLDDAEKMREAFQRLVDIPLMIEDEVKDYSENDILTSQLLSNDLLNAWERRRKQVAERTILLAAKIISQSIAPSFSEGYSWCVETIKQSVYALLAIELEMNKAVDLLKHGELELAIEALLSFNNKESKVASAASNNLSMISIMKGPEMLDEAVQYSEQALSLDRYNFNALVNRGNIYYLNGNFKLAQQCYKESLQVEASCVQAIYNLGLVTKELGQIEEAKKYFYKLNDMLLNNVEVLTQLASIYELQEDTAQAIELYTQANNLAPTDPAILLKLANIYDMERDKAQAFQCHYDSYRYFPANIEVIKWLGNYYLHAQFAEKAVNYFEKAALMEPNNIQWHLLIGSCHRRSGNFQKAIELYKQVHRRFPNNIECLKFLIQLCKDLRMTTEEKEYSEKMSKLEKINQLKIQRESESGQSKRNASVNLLSQPHQSTFLLGSATGSPNNSRPVSSRSSNVLLSTGNGDSGVFFTKESTLHETTNSTNNYQSVKRGLDSVDWSYKDPVGPAPYRSITGAGKSTTDIFEINDILEDDLLPE